MFYQDRRQKFIFWLPESSHRRNIYRDMDHWLPWCATNIHLPHVLRSGKIKNERWNISVNISPYRHPKTVLRRRLTLSTWCNKVVHVLLTYLELETITGSNFEWTFPDFGPFRNISGPSNQLLRPIALEWSVGLCHADVP